MPTPTPIPALAPTESPVFVSVLPEVASLCTEVGTGVVGTDPDDVSRSRRSVDWKLSWNIGARTVTVRVKTLVKTEPSCVMDCVAISGKTFRPILSRCVPEHWPVRIRVEVVAVATQVLPFRFVHT